MQEKSILMERFCKKFMKDPEGGCWNWIAGCRHKDQYGAFKLNGKTVDAHRVSYLLFKGDIVDNLFVLHSCDNMKCVNPEHLFLGTHGDNMADYIRKYGAPRKTIDKEKNIKEQSHRIVHGGPKRYEKGCRCELCVKGMSDRHKRWKLAKKTKLK